MILKMDIDATSDYPIASTAFNGPKDNFYTPFNRDFYAKNSYSNLDPSKHEIRLLELLPVTDGEPLEVRLISPFFLPSDSTSRPRYCAVSYFAGNHKETELVYVNGIHFNAFANLAHALRQIARGRTGPGLQGCPQLLWADQICINQSDLMERSHQVGFMRKIYESAEVVFACLGQDPSNGRWIQATKHLYVENLSTSEIGFEDSVFYAGGRVLGNFDKIDFIKDLQALGALLRSQWWKRGWIYQEVIVAKRILVLFGHGVVGWEALSPCVQIIDRAANAVAGQISAGRFEIPSYQTDKATVLPWTSRYAAFMIQSRKDWQEKQEKNIIELLCHAQDCSVTDLRDRVFAFAGLANPGYGITPDYTIDVPATFRLACKRIILHESSLNVLTCCNSGSEEDTRRQDIPSWTPDWSSSCGPYNFIYDPVIEYRPLRASGEHRSTAAFHSLNSIPDCVLRTQCLFIDNLESGSSLHPQYLCGLPSDLRFWKLMAGLSDIDDFEMDDRSTYCHNPSITTLSAFWRVVFRGMPFQEGRQGIVGDKRQMATLAGEARELGRFFRSPKGYLGVGKRSAALRHTDFIAVLIGANVPFILRKKDDHYLLVSDAYVEGLMHGEAIEMMKRGDLVVDTIDIH
jgi:hypothetical protein